VRGILQYVVPKYQGTGLIGALFAGIYNNFPKYGITELEAGTMLEDNIRPIQVFQRLGGKIIKTYRIFGKESNQNDL
jgi:GNAT superfamily N-acetyltransferase